MRRFFLFLDEYRLNFIFVKFSTKNFYEKFFSLHHAKLLPHYYTKLLPHYRTKVKFSYSQILLGAGHCQILDLVKFWARK